MNSLNKIPIIRKLKRFWSIPIVRIAAGLLCIVLVASMLVGVFKGCSKPENEESDISREVSAEQVFVEQSVEESEVSAEPVVLLPQPWIYGSVDNISSVITSDYGIIINATTRQVLGGKNYTQIIYPASMTKIMTLIVACQSNLDLEAEYTLSYKLINKYYEIEATTTGVYAGDTVKIKDLLYGAILLSAADATAAIAETVAGSEEEFVKLMNAKAEEIGCKNTHFANTNGLHNTNNYSTLGDVALILDYAMSIPLCKEILSTDTYYTGATPKNSNGYKFFSTMFSRIDIDAIDGMTVAGGKTGYVSETRHCLASMAVGDNGEKFIVVTVGGKLWQNAINDCVSLYDKYYNGDN